MMSDSDAREWAKARSLVGKQWLRDGESLRTFARSSYGNYRSEIRRYPPFVWKIVQALGWSAVKLFYPLPMFFGHLPTWRGLERFEGQPPPVIAFGPGPQCRAAEVLRLGPRDRGVWVLSKDRFGFAAFDKEKVTKTLPSGKTRKDYEDRIAVRIDVSATQFTFEGNITRRIARKDATYLRICFHDGSGIDVLSARTSR